MVDKGRAQKLYKKLIKPSIGAVVLTLIHCSKAQSLTYLISVKKRTNKTCIVVDFVVEMTIKLTRFDLLFYTERSHEN